MSILDKVVFRPAKNEHNTKHLFYARKQYKKEALFNVSVEKRKRVIDRHDERDLYGKINSVGCPVIVLNSGLSPLLTQDEATFSVDFVTTMFKDMVDEYNFLTTKRKMFPGFGGNLDRLQAKTGWSDPEVLYQAHLTNMKEYFIQEYLEKTKRKILNFNDMVQEFVLFVRENASDFPMTLSCFIMSNYCPPNVSGLQIDLTTDDKGDDSLKKQIIRDKNFTNFIKLASKYGFYIDKNSPSTLVADLGSTKTRIYMNAYGVSNAKQYFDEYCIKAYTLDMKNLQDLLYDCYYTFFKSKPFYKEQRICENTGKLKVEQHNRYVRDKAGLERETGDEYWDSLYFFVRQIETGVLVKENVRRDILKKVRVIRSIHPKSNLDRYYNEYITTAGELGEAAASSNYNHNLAKYIENTNRALSIIDNFFLDRNSRLARMIEASMRKKRNMSILEADEGVSVEQAMRELGDVYTQSGAGEPGRGGSSGGGGSGGY